MMWERPSRGCDPRLTASWTWELETPSLPPPVLASASHLPPPLPEAASRTQPWDCDLALTPSGWCLCLSPTEASVGTFKTWQAVWISAYLALSMAASVFGLSASSLIGGQTQDTQVYEPIIGCVRAGTPANSSWFCALAWGVAPVHCGTEKPWRGQDRDGEGAWQWSR